MDLHTKIGLYLVALVAIVVSVMMCTMQPAPVTEVYPTEYVYETEYKTEYIYETIESTKPAGIADQVADVRSAVVHIRNETMGWQGSGCIIDETGVVATARHVTENGESYLITLDDGRKYRTHECAQHIGYDIAFLKIDPLHPVPENENLRLNDLLLTLYDDLTLPTVKLADPCDMRVGDPIFAVGSPFGWDNFNSVTMGIVSATQRDLDKDSWSPMGWSVTFQSDAGICPGNSGGPIFNIDGGFVGVVVAGYRGAEVNYSVPISVFSGDLDMIQQWFVMNRYKAPETVKQDDGNFLSGVFGIITSPITIWFD